MAGHRVYLDADVLIWHLRGEAAATDRLRALAADTGNELWIGAMQRAEILFFMREHEEHATLTLLSRLRTEAVTETIVDLAGEWFRRYQPSHGIDPNDALLAASAYLGRGRLITQNLKHYPMPELRVEKGW